MQAGVQFALAPGAGIGGHADRQGAAFIAQVELGHPQVQGAARRGPGLQGQAVVAQVAQVEGDERAGQARAVRALAGDAVGLDRVEPKAVVVVVRLVGQAAAQGHARGPGQGLETLADLAQRCPAATAVAGAGDAVAGGVVHRAVQCRQFQVVVAGQRQVVALEEQPVAPTLEVVAVVDVVAAAVVLLHQAHADLVVRAPAIGVLAHQVQRARFACGQRIDVGVVVAKFLSDRDEGIAEGVLVVEAQRLQAVVPPDTVVVVEALATERQRKTRVIADQVALDVQLAQLGVPALGLLAFIVVGRLVGQVARLAGVVVQPQAAVDHPSGPAFFRRVPGERRLVAQAVEAFALAADLGVLRPVAGLHGELVEELRGDHRLAAVNGRDAHRRAAVGLGAGDFLARQHCQGRQGEQGAEQGWMGFHRVASFNISLRAARARSMSSLGKVLSNRLIRPRARVSPRSRAMRA